MPNAPVQRHRLGRFTKPQRNNIDPAVGRDEWVEKDPHFLNQNVAEDTSDSDDWIIEKETDSAAIGGTEITIIGPLNNIPIVAGRRYRVTFFARTINLSDALDEVEVRVQKDADPTNPGFVTIQDGKYQAGTGAGGENPGPVLIVANYRPAGNANVHFRVRAERVSGAGTGHVIGATSLSPMYLLVEPVPNIESL